MPGRQRGRPRDPRAHEAILSATRDLLTTDGYERLTIEAVAARAGVGKQTVYRRWPAKSAMVADAVLAGRLDTRPDVVPDTGDLAADLRTWLHALFTGLTDPRTVALVRGLTAASAEDAEGSRRVHAVATGPQRDALVQRLRAGGLPGDTAEFTTDVVLGLVLYRALDRSPIDPAADAEHLLRLVLGGPVVDTATPPE